LGNKLFPAFQPIMNKSREVINHADYLRGERS